MLNGNDVSMYIGEGTNKHIQIKSNLSCHKIDIKQGKFEEKTELFQSFKLIKVLFLRLNYDLNLQSMHFREKSINQAISLSKFI